MKNSLQLRAIISISIIFIVLISLVTFIEYENSKKLILSNMESSGKQTVAIHSQNLSSWIKSRLAQVEVIANTEIVSSMDYSKILPYFTKEQKNYGGAFNSFGISDKTGKLTLQNGVAIDISTEESFLKVLNGEKIISNPFQAKENPSDLIISMECPVRDSKGNTVGIVSGACLVSTVYKENTNFHIGKTDKVYILDKNGTVLYPQNETLINKDNAPDGSNKVLSTLIKDAISEESYIGEYKDDIETKMVFSSHVQGTDWYMLLEVPTREYTSKLKSLLYFIIAVTVIAIFFLIAVSTIMLRRFFNRLSKISLIADEVAVGNLTTSLPEAQDELGRINISFNKMIDNLRKILVEIKEVTGIVVESSASYREVSVKVIDEGRNTKKSIEDLSDGAKNTAEEIQNITASINDMENKSKGLVEISTNIDNMIAETKEKTYIGSKSLEDTVRLLYKMKDSVSQSSDIILNLSKESENIENITKAISSISHQTNMLALNASIEAARAGENGKGFSIVADEVKKLAEESSTATKEISNEIKQIRQKIADAVGSMGESINYVSIGTSSIDGTLSVFMEIEAEIEKIKDVSLDISEIAKSLLDENVKIYEAVSNTSAISEEAVASTECFREMINTQECLFLNLKGASENLDELSAALSNEVSRFKLK